jgi:hypothetical protein
VHSAGGGPASVEPFGFVVEHITEDDTLTAVVDHWAVLLPEKYDRWAIAGDPYGHGVPHPEAIAALERFIAEATDALTRLRDRNADGAS